MVFSIFPKFFNIWTIRILFILIFFFLVFCITSKCFGEYRHYTYLISYPQPILRDSRLNQSHSFSKKKIKPYTIESGLDLYSLRQYHSELEGATITLLNTRLCPHHTGRRKNCKVIPSVKINVKDN
jgi:hypothetical protein